MNGRPLLFLMLTVVLWVSCGASTPTSPQGWSAQLQLGSVNISTTQPASLEHPAEGRLLSWFMGSKTPLSTQDAAGTSHHPIHALLSFSVAGKPITQTATLKPLAGGSALQLAAGSLWGAGVLDLTSPPSGEPLKFQLEYQNQTLQLSAAVDPQGVLDVPLIQQVSLHIDTVDVQWTPVEQAHQYRVAVDEDADLFNGSLIVSPVLSGSTWHGTLPVKLNKDHTYHVFVVASTLKSSDTTRPYPNPGPPLLSLAHLEAGVQAPVLPGTLKDHTLALNFTARVGHSATQPLLISSGTSGLKATLQASSSTVTLSPTSLELGADSTTTVQVTMECPATPGLVQAKVQLTTNDPLHARVDVPLTLDCQPELQVQPLWQRPVRVEVADGAWSPDGSWYAVVDDLTGQVRVLDPSLKVVQTLPSPPPAVQHVRWLDNTTLVLQTTSQISVWDLQSNPSQVSSWPVTHTGEMDRLEVSPATKMVVFSDLINPTGPPSTLTSVFTGTGVLVKNLPGLSRATFSPDGSRLAGWSQPVLPDGSTPQARLQVYDTGSWTVLLDTPLEAADLRSPYHMLLKWNPAGTSLALLEINFQDQTVLHTVDVDHHTQSHTPVPYNVGDLVVDRQNRVHFAVRDGRLVRFDPARQEWLSHQVAGPLPLTEMQVELNPQQDSLLWHLNQSGGCAGNSTVLTSTDLEVLNGEGTWPCLDSRLVLDEGGDLIQYDNDQLQIFDGQSGRLKILLPTAKRPADRALSAHHNGHGLLAVGHPEGHVDVTRLSTGEVQQVPTGSDLLPSRVMLSPAGTHLLLADATSRVQVHDVKTGVLLQAWTGSTLHDTVRWLDNQRVYWRNNDHIVVANVTTGETLELPGFVSDWRLLTSDDTSLYHLSNQTLKILDLKTLTMLAVNLKFRLPDSQPLRLDSASDGKHLLITYRAGGQLHTSVFDLTSGQELLTIHTTSEFVVDVKTRPSGKGFDVVIHTDSKPLQVWHVEAP